ncbi:hypothetical protein IWQ48_003791 [Labrenzia sp. EL_13]|nr:hypothetical protein [Labrenzia sp. EL_13]
MEPGRIRRTDRHRMFRVGLEVDRLIEHQVTALDPELAVRVCNLRE